jgi:hypothetical protein
MPRTATRLREAGAVAERTYSGIPSLDVQGATFDALAGLAFSVESAEVGARGTATLRTIEATRPVDVRATIEILEAGPRDVVVTVEVFPSDRTLAEAVQQEIAGRLPRTSGAGP